MTAIEVAASKTYTVEIGAGLLPELGAKTAALGRVKKVCIVSDSNVWPLYGAAADASLHLAGLETSHSFRNSTAYIQNWLTVLKNDKRFIVSASGKAEKAVNLILGS